MPERWLDGRTFSMTDMLVIPVNIAHIYEYIESRLPRKYKKRLPTANVSFFFKRWAEP
jgi:hypothetical protein